MWKAIRAALREWWRSLYTQSEEERRRAERPEPCVC